MGCVARYLAKITVVVCLSATDLPLNAQVIINEVDADTPGADTEEFVELFDGGAGNTDLTGLVVVFFNGGNDQTYRTIDLDGHSTDASGFFVLGNEATPNIDLNFPNGGLQNGPDAVALYQGTSVDFPNGSSVTTTNLLDALVYDSGDADDAGLLVLLNSGQPQVDENGNGQAAQQSMQRIPNGSGGARNTNTYTLLAPSPGEANQVPVLSTPVFINELDADTPGSDTAEFVELFDGGAGNTDLSSLVVVFFNGGNDQSYRAIELDGHSTDASGFFVLGNAAAPNVDLTFPNGGLQNGPDAVALFFGNGSNFPNNTPVTTNNLVDAVVYGTDDPDDAGLLALLNSGQPQVNENANVESADESVQRIPNGSGGKRNTDTYLAVPPTPGSPNVVPVLSTPVFINEIDVDTPGADNLEFIELFDGGAGNTDLTGLVVVLFNGSDDASYAAFDLEGLATDGSGFFVLGNAAVPNVDFVFSDSRIQNGADAVAFYFGDAADFSNDTPVTTRNLVDAVVYGTGQPDDSGLLGLLNSGQPQVDESGGGDVEQHSLQRIPNGSGGVLNTGSYLAIPPTPGATNLAPPCDLSVAPTFHDFGDVEVGTYVDQVIELANAQIASENCAGRAKLKGSREFSIVSGEKFDIKPGETHEMVVRFQCLSAHDPRATITISSNDPDGDITVDLVGNCVLTQIPDIASNPETLNFGRVPVGSPREKAFVLKNAGVVDLRVTDARLAGSNGNEFALVDLAVPFTLKPGEQLTVTTRFTPDSLENRTGRVKFTSNDPDENPFLVRFRGEGRDPVEVPDPDIVVIPSALDFGDVALGSQSERFLAVVNEGSVDLQVDSTVVVGPNADDWRVTAGGAPFTLVPGDSQQLAIEFAPTTSGVKSATLQIVSNDGDQNIVPVALTGAGLDTSGLTLLINEVDADTPSSDQEEFVELFDGGTGSMDLSGLVVVFYNGSDDQSYAAFDLDGFATDEDGYFVLGNEAVQNVDLVFSNNSLQNGADAVALYRGDAADFPNDTPITLVNLIDAVVYDTDDANDPALLTLLNPEQPQVNEDGGGDKDNQSLQRIPNGTGGLRNTSTYLSAIPTPGSENGTPPVVAATETVRVTFSENGTADFQGVTLDAYLDGKKTDYNTGSTALLRVGSQEQGRPYCSVIKFDCLQSLPEIGLVHADQVVEAWVQFYVHSGATSEAGGFPVDLYRLNRDWAEGESDYDPARFGEVTWQSTKHGKESWAVPGAQGVGEDREGSAEDTQFLKSRGRVRWNVTGAIRQAVGSGENFGWLLEARDKHSAGFFRLASSEHPKASRRPKLIIIANLPSTSVALSAREQASLASQRAQLAQHRAVEAEASLPTEFGVLQNYPNPFNPETRIAYMVASPATVTLTVFDVRGGEVRRLLDRVSTPAGRFTSIWNGRDQSGREVASGTYFYRVVIESSAGRGKVFVQSNKMILLR